MTDLPAPAADLLPYIADRAELALATDLIEQLGLEAAREARTRADRSRDLGNHLHFCRWRQVERLARLLSDPVPVGTVH